MGKICKLGAPRARARLDGLGVWFSLRVREVPGSNPGQAHIPFKTRRSEEKMKAWRCRGSNPRPSKCESDALPLSYIPTGRWGWVMKLNFTQPGSGDEGGHDSWHRCRGQVMDASIAQWQSTGLVNQGSRVQSSLEARVSLFNPFFSDQWAKAPFENWHLHWHVGLFSSVVEHWSRKPGVVSSNLTGGKSQYILHREFQTRMRLTRCAQGVTGSLAERSKALVLGTSPKGRGFESHSCQKFYKHVKV